MKSPSRSRALAVCASLAIAAGITACGGDANEETGAANQTDVVIVGGSSEQRAILEETLVGFGSSAIRRIELAPGEDKNGPIEVTIVSDGEEMRARWEEAVLTGIFVDRSEAESLPAVATLKSSEGESVLDPPNELGQRANEEVARLAEEGIRAAAQAAGADVSEIDVSTPYGIAPSIQLSVADPAQFIKDRLGGLLEAIDQLPDSETEGSFVEVYGADGNAVFRFAPARRQTSSSVWVLPSLAGCSPVPILPATEENVSDCPA